MTGPSKPKLKDPLPPALLFVDMLGVRDRWRTMGRDGARASFQTLRSTVIEVLDRTPSSRVLVGAIESDSVGIVLRTAADAVRFGCALYVNAFERGNTQAGPRTWLRGVIIPYEGPGLVAPEAPLLESHPNVLERVYFDSLLEGVAAEKSGYQGMRLLIGGGFSEKKIDRAAKLDFGDDRRMAIARRLKGDAYPGRLAGFSDILWMATTDESEWVRRKMIMANRMRWALQRQEEMIHAGATQALFSVCGVIVADFCRQHGIERSGGGVQPLCRHDRS